MSPSEELAGAGAVGLAILSIKIVHTLVKQRKTDRPLPPDHESFSEKEYSLHRKLDRIIEVLTELHKWHDQRDEDGALKWLNKPSIEREIVRMGRLLDDLKRDVDNG